MSWRTRIRLLLSRVKWPGWVMFVWGVLWWTPELYGKADFWVKAAKAVGGNFGLIATATASPWFSIFLILAGILWLCFVGESRYAIRHPAMPYIGWGFVGLLAFAFWSVLVAGYISQRVRGDKETEVNILKQSNEQLQQKVAAVEKELERQTSPWLLTDGQKSKLTEALNKILPGVTYKLMVHVIAGCPQCAGYTNDLGELWKKVPGWEVQGTTNHGLDPLLIGMNVVVDMEGCPSEELRLVVSALKAAELKHAQVKAKGILGSGTCALVVGNRPQE